jgi:hypothetical protein
MSVFPVGCCRVNYAGILESDVCVSSVNRSWLQSGVREYMEVVGPV